MEEMRTTRMCSRLDTRCWTIEDVSSDRLVFNAKYSTKFVVYNPCLPWFLVASPENSPPLNLKLHFNPVAASGAKLYCKGQSTMREEEPTSRKV
jgi:hypothetical protein